MRHAGVREDIRGTYGGLAPVEAVASLLSAGDTGHTTDEITDALDLPIDGAALQSELEEMVVRGILARRGIGRGALYTLTMLVPTTGDASDQGGMRRKGLTSQKAG